MFIIYGISDEYVPYDDRYVKSVKQYTQPKINYLSKYRINKNV